MPKDVIVLLLVNFDAFTSTCKFGVVQIKHIYIDLKSCVYFDVFTSIYIYLRHEELSQQGLK